MRMNLSSLGLVLALALPAPAMAMAVITSTDGSALANSLLGSGVTITGVTLIGASNQQGFFSGGLASGIGIDSGVILTSGNANLAPGPNSDDGAGASTGTGSDPNLASLIPGYSIYDKNLLEFDFITPTSNLYFSYVFASDEYNEYVNSSFNDVFGFFVDGVNIALLPDGHPVSINNVNCGYSLGGSLPGSSPSDHCGYFNNNDLNNGGPFFDIEYDGFTDVFLAKIEGLSIGQHHMKLAIGDAGDSILDSAVFLKAGSFSGTNPIPEPASLALIGIGLAGLGAMRRRKLAS